MPDAKVDAMSTITVTLRNEHLIQIRERAQASGTTPEGWLQASIETLLAEPQTDFDQAAGYVLEKNDELYRRLA